MPKRERTGKQVKGKYVTQKDVAERAGVSPSIVSYVINNGPRSISEETRERVLLAIKELDYRPNVHAQKLMRASWESELAPKQFGLIVCGHRQILRRAYYPNIIYGVLDEAARQNLNMRFMLFMSDLNNPLTFNQLINPEEISSLILIDSGPNLLMPHGKVLLAEMRQRIPHIISIGRPLPNLMAVTFDLANATRMCAAYLLELGHRRIAFIGTVETRLNGFKRAFQDANQPFDPDLVCPVMPHNDIPSGYQEMNDLFEVGRVAGPQRITAVCAASDEVAWGAMRSIREHGLRIPEDISIIGLGDDQMNDYTVPPLTCVRLPQEEMGSLSVQTLLKQIQDPDLPVETVYLPTELVVRASTAPLLPS